MAPNFNGVWSASEINIVKSLIASHTTNNTYTDATKKKHTDIIDELQARFPCKRKHQVTNLYVELVVEMNAMQSNNQHVVASNALQNDNFGMSMEDTNMDNIDMLHGYLMDDTESMKMVEEQPHKLNIIPKKMRQCPVKFWTKEEHK